VLPNGPEMAAAFVTIAQSAVTAPLNPAYRADEFDFYLSDLGAKAIVLPAGYDGPALEAAGRHGLVVLRLAFDRRAPAGDFTLRPRAAAHAGRHRPGRARRRGADPAHLRHHLAPEDRAAAAANVAASARHIGAPWR
jgi:acyl-CoA synthetase (AMP-forming)/AMP-acid ligase II